MNIKRIVFAFSVLALLVGCTEPSYIDPGTGGTGGGSTDPEDPTPKPEYETDEAVGCRDIVGIDQFGRSFGTIDGYRKDRTVGMFFWLWIGQPYAHDIYDATEIFALPDGKNIIAWQNNSISPNGGAHYWGKPLWGYYNSADEWVIRKQMEMITLAGVDFIFFDHTNALLYGDVQKTVMKVIHEMLEEGWNAPKVASYLHSRSFQTLRELYDTIYNAGIYPDTWYRVDGKPMVIAYTSAYDDLAEAATRDDKSYSPGELSREILDYFHFYKPNWPFDQTFDDGFTWVEWSFPQPYHTASKMMNVTVASHPNCPMSFSLTRDNWVNWGRGWDPARKKNISENVDKGTFFQAQWDEVLKRKPALVSVGGWNEWIAYKTEWQGEYKLVDAASKEYSRDIEPMEGGYEDSFYLQLISNIRKYKGVVNKEKRTQSPKTIDIGGPLSQWDDVKYVEKHPDKVQMARDSYGGSKVVRYTEDAPENALSEVKVSYDASNVYFYVKAREAWNEPSSKTNWLNIYIGTGEPEVKGWNGYEYFIGTSYAGGKVSVESVRSDNGRTALAYADFKKSGDVLQIAVPRNVVGLANVGGFYFKVAAGVKNPENIMNSYKSGSVMPMGRLSYQYYFAE